MIPTQRIQHPSIRVTQDQPRQDKPPLQVRAVPALELCQQENRQVRYADQTEPADAEDDPAADGLRFTTLRRLVSAKEVSRGGER